MSQTYADLTRRVETLGEALFAMSGRLVDVHYFDGKGNGEAYERVVETFEALRIALERGGVQPGLYDEAAFLVQRLRSLESWLEDDALATEYYGHVAPSVARLEGILASADTRPQGGDAKQAPFTSGAVLSDSEADAQPLPLIPSSDTSND